GHSQTQSDAALGQLDVGGADYHFKHGFGCTDPPTPTWTIKLQLLMCIRVTPPLEGQLDDGAGR
ncbi:MAG TPA: hypothetical protein VGC82_12195, partial [Rhodopila sp.]